MSSYSENRWHQFNSIIDAPDLDNKEKGLLLILFRFVNYLKGYADPSRELIKKLAHISDNRTLDGHLNDLVGKGYLLKEKGGGNKRTKYYIMPKSKGVISEENTLLDLGENTSLDSGKNVVGEGVKSPLQKEEKQKEKYINLKELIDNVISNVSLTQEQYDKLIDKYGQDLVHNKIVMYDIWIETKEFRCNAFKIINIWCKREVDKLQENKKIKSNYYKAFDFEED